MKNIQLVSDEALGFIFGGSAQDIGPAMRQVVAEAKADGLSLLDEINTHMVGVSSVGQFVQIIKAV